MTSGRPGPVNLDMPFNVFQEEAEVELRADLGRLRSRRSGASPDDIRATRRLLQAARAPGALHRPRRHAVGGGRRSSPSSRRRCGIPVITSPNGMGCLDMRDPLSLGFIGRNGAYPANQAGRHADLVIAHRRALRRPLVVVLDAGLLLELPDDQAGARRHRPAGDRPQLPARRSASSPTRECSSASCSPSCDDAALDGASAVRASGTPRSTAGSASGRPSSGPNFDIHATPIRPERVVADCRAVLPDDAIISLDSGVHHNWFMQFWEARRPQTMLNTWGYSGMGFGVERRSSARKLAAPDRPCVSICGDGGFTMVPHVLCTAVEYDIPAVWVVWNNFAWAAIRDLQYGLLRRPRDRHRLLPGPGPQALQPRLRGVGARLRASRASPSRSRRTSRARSSTRSKLEQALPDRRARRRRRSVRRAPAPGQLPPIPHKEPIFGKKHVR